MIDEGVCGEKSPPLLGKRVSLNYLEVTDRDIRKKNLGGKI